MDLTKLRKGATVHYRDGSKATVQYVERMSSSYEWDVSIVTDVYSAGLHMKDGRHYETPRGGTDPRDIVAIRYGQETPSEKPSDDIVKQPSHYTQYEIEPVTFIMVNRLSFEIGNIVKYACRAGDKIYPGMDWNQSRITDLEKVRRYAEMEINRIKGEEIL